MTAAIPAQFSARVRYDEPMSQHTSWHAGGPADVLFTPRDVDDLATFLRALPRQTPLYWVGLGSNLLVREGGIRGVVIATPGAFTRIEQRPPHGIYCEAGVPCARIARLCVNWGLGQGEFFSGIPGTLGGALAMNAGAFGDETWRHVLSTQTMDRQGERRTRSAREFNAGYRQLEWPAGAAEEWFLSAELGFEPQAASAQPSVQALLERRRATQPLGLWSCGSVFKNPAGDHAARLIEAAGLKGYRIGDAVVSDKHANFIINLGKASATELEQLIRHVQSTVQRSAGVLLEPEVRIVGEPAAAAAATVNGGRH
ncbi:MAG TPA: UDP-N-acetylmuramate dehydrogenase [Steroidobacteraceae bacterium]